MDAEKIVASQREKTGTRYARRLRAKEQMPAIVYGHGEAPVAIALPSHAVEVALDHGSHLLKIELDGKEGQYLIKDVQYDYLGTTPIHVDLARVNVHEVVEVSVPITLRGTPEGAREGGVVDQVLTELAVRCKVTAIPEEIRLGIHHMKVNDTLYVRDLDLPEGVEAVDDADEAVVVLRYITEEEVEEEEAVEEGAEPEVIGKAEEEGEAGEAPAESEE